MKRFSLLPVILFFAATCHGFSFSPEYSRIELRSLNPDGQALPFTSVYINAKPFGFTDSRGNLVIMYPMREKQVTIEFRKKGYLSINRKVQLKKAVKFSETLPVEKYLAVRCFGPALKGNKVGDVALQGVNLFINGKQVARTNKFGIGVSEFPDYNDDKIVLVCNRLGYDNSRLSIPLSRDKMQYRVDVVMQKAKPTPIPPPTTKPPTAQPTTAPSRVAGQPVKSEPKASFAQTRNSTIASEKNKPNSSSYPGDSKQSRYSGYSSVNNTAEKTTAQRVPIQNPQTTTYSASKQNRTMHSTDQHMQPISSATDYKTQKERDTKHGSAQTDWKTKQTYPTERQPGDADYSDPFAYTTGSSTQPKPHVSEPEAKKHPQEHAGKFRLPTAIPRSKVNATTEHASLDNLIQTAENCERNYAASGDRDELNLAIRTYEKVLNFKQSGEKLSSLKYSTIANRLALHYLNGKKPAKAEEVLTEAIHKDRRYPICYYNLAIAYMHQNKYAKARINFKQTLAKLKQFPDQIDPNMRTPVRIYCYYFKALMAERLFEQKNDTKFLDDAIHDFRDFIDKFPKPCDSYVMPSDNSTISGIGTSFCDLKNDAEKRLHTLENKL